MCVSRFEGYPACPFWLYNERSAVREGERVRYDVVLVGFRLNASMKPAQALQTVLGIDPQTCKELTRQFPANVLAGVSRSRADKVAEQLTDVGAKVEVRESRLSHLSQPAGGQPFPANEESGNYEIGEILAPMKRGNLSGLKPVSAPPAARRPSREELDEALRESFRPETEGLILGNATPSSPAELRGNSTASTPSSPSSPEILGNYTPESAEHNVAFAGLHNFGESLDTLESRAPALQVDEVTLRSIQRAPETEAERAARRGSPFTRFRHRLSGLVGPLLGWLAGLFWLSLISSITLLAVAYALDPVHIFGAFDDPARAPSRLLHGALGN